MRYPDLVPSSEAPARSYENVKLREKIAADIADYLARGGTIKQCTAEDNRGWNFDPHRPAIIMRNELKAATWEAQVRREQSKMA